MKTFGTQLLESPLLAVAAGLALLAACGDLDGYALRPGAWAERAPTENWAGTYVELVRSSSACDPGDEGRMIVSVGTQIEFPGESVAELKSACSGNADAEVSIDIEGRSIVYDFSSVSQGGAYTSARFNGYVFTELAGVAPRLLHAMLDREASTVELNDEALRVEEHELHANFEGVEFRPSDFVKIDLVFVDSEAL